ncbi:uncharacterized protein F4822DRAFT_387456 [Hypoxylon trugodes]|uniref:uncharacterized protein n=1 Tax=Hypoxylon trugodes TaxID=326681 RepID=UPI00218DE0A3|nr:uncharacterized protein F4822DRAFT_387456 [Hypoxylon trugodes]KAI1394204.1 hypothetical protein F4822DRAFT_387456 [Hypoxylon trugodes]
MDLLLDTSRGNIVCNSVQEVQDKLHHSLASKLSDTRAEHASLTFELRHNTIFHLSADAESNSNDGTVNPGNPVHQYAIARSVNVLETVQNQPPDDPVLQRTVAKHIVGAIGVIDSSSWIAREVSRNAQGWTFTYICKDSLLAWNRANAKNTERPVIGSHSGPGSLDPTNSSRPAFDCRGTLSVAFSKSARGVIVKYSHTPIHKTVQQLMDLLAPPPQPAPVNKNNGNSRRTSKVRRPPPTEGEEGPRRKRPKKKRKAPEAPMGEPAIGDGQNTATNTESQSVEPQGTNPSDPRMMPVLNVHPEEAERRRQLALDLLNARGIDPTTLSAEQFSIFSNQAPDLQATSLEMLARYGAERLRIVHPSDEGRSSTNSTPAQEQSANVTSAGGSASVPTSGTTETPTKKKRTRGKALKNQKNEVPIADGAVLPVEQSGEVGTTSSTLKPSGRKTRGSCKTCKDRKVKCTKQHPTCSVCKDAGLECVYLLAKPRPKSEKPATKAAEVEDSDVPGEMEQFQALNQVQQETALVSPAPRSPSPQVQMLMQHSAPTIVPPPLDPDNEEFIPDPNILSGPTEHSHTTTNPPPSQYYQDSHTGLTFPQNPQMSSGHTTMPTLTFPESQTRETRSPTSPNMTFSSTAHHNEHQSGLGYTQPVVATHQKKPSTSTSGRRSLPTASQNRPTPVPAPVIPQHASNWNASHTTVHTASTSPTLTKQQEPKRSRSRKSGVEASQQAHDSLNQVMAIPQAVVQQQSQPSSATSSPYQAAAQPKSRQGHRSRTNTPVAYTSRPLPQAPQAAVNPPYNTTPSTSIPNYDSYSRYDNSTQAQAQYDGMSNEQSSSRITYKPGAYRPNPVTTTSTSYSSAPAYDHARTTTPSNPLLQAFSPSVGYNSHSATGTQWPTSQTRGNQQNAQAHTNTARPTASTTTSTTHSYGTREAEPQAQRQAPSYNQPQSQPQSYGSYSSTQQANTNQQQTQQNWYGFQNPNTNNNGSNTNQSSYHSTRSGKYSGTGSSSQPAYNNHGSNVPNYSGHGYGSGADDQALYDILRASGPTH